MACPTTRADQPDIKSIEEQMDDSTTRTNQYCLKQGKKYLAATKVSIDSSKKSKFE